MAFAQCIQCGATASVKGEAGVSGLDRLRLRGWELKMISTWEGDEPGGHQEIATCADCVTVRETKRKRQQEQLDKGR